MPVQRIVLLSLLVAVAGCGDDARSAAPNVLRTCSSCVDGGFGGSGAGTGGAAGFSGSPSTTPDAGPGAGGDVDGGGGGSAPEPVCGNAVAEDGEQCDGDDFDELSCQSFGFSEGSLGCSADCLATTDDCGGVELCSDGQDNDGDGAVDCLDDDCEVACSDFCAAPTPLDSAVLTAGHVEQQESLTDSSCAASPDQSGLVAYSYLPPTSGFADVYLTSNAPNLSLSARADCSVSPSEDACAQTTFGTIQMTVPVTEGEAIFFLVESSDRTVPAAFQLVATARPVACGDGYVDPGEECDDGNVDDSDGCSNDCQFQSSEDNPNGSINRANPYVEPAFYGTISSRNDRDVVSIDVPQGYMLIAQTFDLGDGACGRFEMDSYLELFNAEGDLIEEDDDTGVGFCAALVADGLPGGEYFVRVTASGASTSFPYELDLSLFAP